jgi:hypothetical protein
MDTEQGSSSIRSEIIANMRAKRAQKTVKIPVPRFEGRLVVHCRTLTPRQRLASSLAAQDGTGEIGVDGLIDGAIMGLGGSLEKATTNIDGQEIIVATTWLQLSQELGPEGECGMAQTDEEAVVEVFGDEAELVHAFDLLGEASQTNTTAVVKETVGESGAAS